MKYLMFGLMLFAVIFKADAKILACGMRTGDDMEKPARAARSQWAQPESAKSKQEYRKDSVAQAADYSAQPVKKQ